MENNNEAIFVETKMAYSVYKRYYTQFKTVAGSYDAKTKNICVYLPEQKTEFPKTWKRDGNHYETEGGCRVYFWNTGAARSYVVEHGNTNYNFKTRTIAAGFDSKDKVLQTVAEFESLI